MFFNVYLFTYLIFIFLAALGLLCFEGFFFSSCGERGFSPVVLCGLLTAVASLAVEHGL